ncbi:MAG: TonB C-terminal domain-containing protein [Gemmatimonadales bacterium]|jgi:outer membrane biosynthesis protein TonB|nr:MAG: TonB C-terminal domain-containing protein [Gemmatimonadales bacterium]
MGSLLIHGGVGVLAFLAALREPTPLTFITYEVQIVSPPPSRTEEAETVPAVEEELVIERPEEAPVEEAASQVPLPEAQPQPEEPEPEPAEETPEPQPEPEVAEEPTTPPAEEATEEDLTGEDIEVRMEGLRQDFPQYYENIIRQIRRCFRPPPGLPATLATAVYFVIREDGTVRDVRFLQQSGNPDFDFEALGAVGDCAGRGRFGPLPSDYPYESLPIIFDFRPSGGDPVPFPPFTTGSIWGRS